MTLDETHDPKRRSWLESANAPGTDFPIQNLPFGVFSKRGYENRRCGIAIGDCVLDVAMSKQLLPHDAQEAAEACASAVLNPLMQLGPAAWRALRRGVSDLLSEVGAERRESVEMHLVPMADAEMHLPVQIPNYTDFYSSIHHATNVGRIFRPDNPLLPNYKWVPIAYHGRASSIRVNGAFHRPKGQIKPADADTPVYAPTRSLDYEVELGFYLAGDTQLGETVPVAHAAERIFGFCLLNDWSARDMQAWEYQPLGPFLAKNFASTVSPWIVTMDALAPYRVPAAARPQGDPQPLPHLAAPGDQSEGGIGIEVEAYLLTRAMQKSGTAPQRLSQASFADNYWTPAQMVAHHASGGCNLQTGDLLGTGTISGSENGSQGSLLELTARGTQPIALLAVEKRGFLEDGDTVILRGHCVREGYARIGFGECRAMVLPAV
jgi:fumarylacetoacetase